MYEDVSKPGHAAEIRGESAVENAEIGQRIDGGSVVGDIVAGAGGEVGRNVECVLGAQLERSFDDAELVPVTQGFDRLAGVASKLVEHAPESRQVSADDPDVSCTGSHGSATLGGAALGSAVSILSSWGMKSK